MLPKIGHYDGVIKRCALRPELLVFLFAHAVFVAAAFVFGYLFWRQEKTTSWIWFAGPGISLWASLHGSYHFIVTQAPIAKAWLRGLAIVFLGINVLLCLWLIAAHTSLLSHALLIHVVLTMYVGWDLVALSYYRKRSGWWYAKYGNLLAHDINFWIIYLLAAYVPALQVRFFPDSEEAKYLAQKCIGITLFVLVTEFIDFTRLSFQSAREAAKREVNVFGVLEGYEKWAPVYARGNAVISVEREHTMKRLREIEVKGRTIVDFGCGAGHYLRALLDAGAAAVIGVEQSKAMTSQIPKEVSSDERVRIEEGGVAAMSRLGKDSADGVLCSLVVDHLSVPEYQDLVRLASDVLRPGGWLYIADVNPYFEQREHCYATFLDRNSVEAKIRVIPHSVAETLSLLETAGFSSIVFREGRVPLHFAATWEEELRPLVGFPLIFEYFSEVPSANLLNSLERDRRPRTVGKRQTGRGRMSIRGLAPSPW